MRNSRRVDESFGAFRFPLCAIFVLYRKHPPAALDGYAGGPASYRSGWDFRVSTASPLAASRFYHTKQDLGLVLADSAMWPGDLPRLLLHMGCGRVRGWPLSRQVTGRYISGRSAMVPCLPICITILSTTLRSPNKILSPAPPRRPAVITMAQHANDRASTHSVEKDLEKVDYIEVSTNKYANIGLTAEETDFYENFPEDKKKKMIRKIDFRLVPVLAVSRNEAPNCTSHSLADTRCQLLYLMAHIDRANIGNAKIEGMVEDLGMTGIQYNIALSLFFGQNIPSHPNSSNRLLTISQYVTSPPCSPSNQRILPGSPPIVDGMTDIRSRFHTSSLKVSSCQIHRLTLSGQLTCCVLTVPCNILLKKFKRPSTYIGILVVSWGIVMTFTGVVKDFAGLVTCRIFLGIAEAGFFPGVRIRGSEVCWKNHANDYHSMFILPA